MWVVASILLLVAATQASPQSRAPSAASPTISPSEEAIRHYAQGRWSEELGLNDEALGEYYRVLLMDPRAGEVARRISEVAARTGNSDQSLEFAERALTLDPNDARAWWLKGGALFGLGKTSESLAALERAAELDSEQVEYQLTLARVAEQLDRTEVVARAYSRAVELDDENGESWFQLAAARARLHDFPAADRALARAVDLNPLRPGVFFLMGWVREGLGRSKEAIELYRRHLSIHSGDQVTRRRLINLLSRQNQFEEAYREVKILARDHEDDLDVIEVAVDLALRSRHEAEATVWIDRMVRQADRDPRLMTKAVALMARHGRQRQAVATADGWRARHPVDPRGLVLTARARAFAGMTDSAIVQARQAVVVEPDSLEPRILLGQLYQGHKRYGEAESLLVETSHRFPEETGVMLDLAFCREQLGDIPGAQVAARDALKHDPDNATVLNFLGYLLADHDQNLNEAVDLIQRALERDPDNGAFIDSLGWAYYRLGRLGEARRELERAVDLTGGDPVVREHLGDVYKGLRLLDLAKDQYKKILATDASNTRVKTKLAEIR